MQSGAEHLCFVGIELLPALEHSGRYSLLTDEVLEAASCLRELLQGACFQSCHLVPIAGGHN